MDLGLQDQHVREIYAALAKNKVLIIVAPTGAGKSTVIPFRLLSALPDSGLPEDFFTPSGRQIVVTQPRRVATGGIPVVIGEKMYGSSVGAGCDIGFRHGQDREQTDAWNRAVFVTDGTLVNWLSQDKARNFSIVIVDEAHERSAQIDLILALMRSELIRHDHLKLIILSATIDADRFKEYFEAILPGQAWIRNFSECEKSFGYDKEFRIGKPLEMRDMVDAVVQKVLEVIRDKGDGGILAFLPGEREIKSAVSKISDSLRGKRQPGKVMVLPLYAALSQKDIDKATVMPTPGKDGQTPRRVIVSTNMAETSVTIPDVEFVIDSGLIKEARWDTSSCSDRLETRWHSQAGCIQRWGRAGRNRQGTVYTLYTEKQFSGFDKHTLPAIARECLDDVLIKAKRAGISALSDLVWIDSPPAAELDRVQAVISARCLTDDAGDLTRSGSETLDLYSRIQHHMGAVPASRVLDAASLLVIADRHGCLVEAATMLIAMDHMGSSLFHKKRGLLVFDAKAPLAEMDLVARRQDSLMAGCADDLDFCIKLVALFEGLEFDGQSFGGAQWADEAHLNVGVFKEICEQRDELMTAFVGDYEDRHQRSLDISLVERLRHIAIAAWPDRAAMIDNGIWTALGTVTSGTLSVNSVMAKRPGPAAGIIGAFSSRDRATDEASVAETIASFVIRATTPGQAVKSLTSKIRELRLRQPKTTLSSLLTDQVSPVGTKWSQLSPAVKDELRSKQDAEAELTAWRPDGDAWVPEFEARRRPLEYSYSKTADSLEITFTRVIPFRPTGGIAGFVCHLETDLIGYVAAADLAITLPNASIARLLDRSRQLGVLGAGRQGVAVFSNLSAMEAATERLIEEGRVSGAIQEFLRRDDGIPSMRILVEPPDPTEVGQIVSVSLPRRQQYLGPLKVGDCVHVTLWSDKEEWRASVVEDEVEKVPDEGELARVALRYEGGGLISDRRITSDELYELLWALPGLEESLRRLYRSCHELRGKSDTLDSDQSTRRAELAMTEIIQIWKRAWGEDPYVTRRNSEVAQEKVREFELSPYYRRVSKQIADDIWAISGALISIKRAPEKEEWLQRCERRVSKFNGELQNAVSERDRIACLSKLEEASGTLAEAVKVVAQTRMKAAQAQVQLETLRKPEWAIDVKDFWLGV